jgi:4'-phosphopantetheinyl transferase
MEWLALDLDAVCDEAADFALLDDGERARAARFVLRRDAARYIAGHAAVRRALGAIADVDPAAWRWTTGPQGKPQLQPPGTGEAMPTAPAPHFNLSHSGAQGLLAWSWTQELGVDLEVHRPLPDLEALARSCFTPEERAAVAACPPAQREAAFFAVWTRKEAVLKALGWGLQLEPSALHVGMAAGPADVHCRPPMHLGLPPMLHRVTVQAVEVAPGATAHLAWLPGVASAAQEARA